MLRGMLDLLCGDDRARWEALGFRADGDTVTLGAVRVRLDGTGGGLRAWSLPALEGIGHFAPGPDASVSTAPHPNGAVAVDHVVVFTDAVARVCDALVAGGGDLRRRAEPPAVPLPMAFVRAGGVILEVAEAGPPTRLWGLVAVVEDLDACAAQLGPLLGAPRAAVQAGRRIATVRAESGIETALAFMTPRG